MTPAPVVIVVCVSDDQRGQLDKIVILISIVLYEKGEADPVDRENPPDVRVARALLSPS